MKQFQINVNNYLARPTKAFFRVQYLGMGRPGNPDYLNDLKNTFNSFPMNKLQNAAQDLHNVLCEDLLQISESLGLSSVVACIVPRAKSENSYHANQKLFRTTVQGVIPHISGMIDGTNY